MVSTIQVPKPRDVQALYERAKVDAKKANIKWSGDIHKGHCAGWGVELTYSVDTDGITVCILKKPFLITVALIEKEVRKYVLS